MSRTHVELPRRQLLVDKFGHRIVATTTSGGGSMRLDLAPCNATRVLSLAHHNVGTLSALLRREPQSQVRTMGVLSRMAPPGTHDSR